MSEPQFYVSMIVTQNDLNSVGQKLYNNGYFQGIVADHILSSFQKSRSVRLLLPNMTSLNLKGHVNG